MQCKLTKMLLITEHWGRLQPWGSGWGTFPSTYNHLTFSA